MSSIVKSFSVGNGDIFYIKHASDNFTVIDCFLKDDNKEAITEEIKEVSSSQLGETQQHIIVLMQRNPKIAIPQLAEQFGISTTAIEKHLKVLKDQGFIKRIGGISRHWEVIQ